MASLRTLDTRARPLAQAFVRALSRFASVTVTSARRDQTQQAALYAAYKSGRSKYPAAAPGHSLHGIGLAFDLHLDPPIYDAAGRLWEMLGLTWGGRFGDRVHFDFRTRG